MENITQKHNYNSIESEYKTRSRNMFITYDLEQRTRNGNTAIYPKIKRVYIAGNIKDWKVGRMHKKSGREVRGISITYEQTRKGYDHKNFEFKCDNIKYEIPTSIVSITYQEFTQIVEVPDNAKNMRFFADVSELPNKYKNLCRT